jgi:hypothetical protein
MEKNDSKSSPNRHLNVAIAASVWCFCITVVFWLLTRSTPVLENNPISFWHKSFSISSELLSSSECLNYLWTSTRDNQTNCENFKTKLYRNFVKRKFSNSRVAYYSNFVATRQILLLSGDIELNPGPIIQGVDSRKDYLEQFVNSLDNSSSNPRIAHINVRSLRNKLDEIKILLKVCRLDVLSITD